MAMTISNNVNGILQSLNKATAASNTSMERMSSGLRINSAKDDAAGLAIATRMQSNLRGMAVAERNAADGLSMLETADAAITQVTDMMTRMKELATQSVNATNTDADRSKLQEEYSALASEITRTISGADFNGRKILAGAAGANTFQVGAGSTDTVSITTTNLTTDTDVTAVTGGDISTAAGATTALTDLSTAIDTMTEENAKFGASMSRFESIQSGLKSQQSSLESARSRIMDTDYAIEMASLQRTQVLQQAASAMLAQANQRPASVLQLLR